MQQKVCVRHNSGCIMLRRVCIIYPTRSCLTSQRRCAIYGNLSGCIMHNRWYALCTTLCVPYAPQGYVLGTTPHHRRRSMQDWVRRHSGCIMLRRVCIIFPTRPCFTSQRVCIISHNQSICIMHDRWDALCTTWCVPYASQGCVSGPTPYHKIILCPQGVY